MLLSPEMEVLGSVYRSTGERRIRLTVQKGRREINTDISIPCAHSSPLDYARDFMRCQLLKTLEDAMLVSETHDDPGDAQ